MKFSNGFDIWQAYQQHYNQSPTANFHWTDEIVIYHKVSNIIRTKFQSLNASSLIL